MLCPYYTAYAYSKGGAGADRNHAVYNAMQRSTRTWAAMAILTQGVTSEKRIPAKAGAATSMLTKIDVTTNATTESVGSHDKIVCLQAEDSDPGGPPARRFQRQSIFIRQHLKRCRRRHYRSILRRDTSCTSVSMYMSIKATGVLPGARGQQGAQKSLA